MNEDIDLPAKRRALRLPKPSHGRISAADVEPGNHLCCLYETEEEHRALITPFLRLGLERGEKVIYAVHAHTAESVLGYLRKDGLDVSSYLARGQLTVVTAGNAYLQEGVFDPEKVIRLLRAETDRALAEGYVGLRTTGEATWVLENPPGSHRATEYEAKLNAFFDGSKCIGLCQYDRRRFPPLVLLNALYTHPVVVLGTGIHNNFYYIPPEDFLKGDVPAALLRHCMENLAARKGLEDELRDAREQLRTVVEERILERWKASEALALSTPAEKPGRMRFAITCPVTVKTAAGGGDRGLERGELLDIGDGGARFQMSRPLPTGTHVILDVHLPAGHERVTTARFEGVVTRAQEEPPYEVVVKFRRKGRILRNEPGGSSTEHKTA